MIIITLKLIINQLRSTQCWYATSYKLNTWRERLKVKLPLNHKEHRRYVFLNKSFHRWGWLAEVKEFLFKQHLDRNIQTNFKRIKTKNYKESLLCDKRKVLQIDKMNCTINKCQKLLQSKKELIQIKCLFRI